MYDITFPELSNRASWVFMGKITDMDDNLLDLTPMEIVFSLRDRNGRSLEASTSNGKITYPSLGIFRWSFTVEDMHGFCPGQCHTGMTLTNDDRTQTAQLSVGPVNIVDGVVP